MFDLFGEAVDFILKEEVIHSATLMRLFSILMALSRLF